MLTELTGWTFAMFRCSSVTHFSRCSNVSQQMSYSRPALVSIYYEHGHTHSKDNSDGNA
jgi:hypothetical protein